MSLEQHWEEMGFRPDWLQACYFYSFDGTRRYQYGDFCNEPFYLITRDNSDDLIVHIFPSEKELRAALTEKLQPKDYGEKVLCVCCNGVFQKVEVRVYLEAIE